VTVLLVVLAAVVAVAAAVRSTWSPCGLSMLSSITPIGERGRDHRFVGTALWFTLGGVLGGLTLGALAAVLALGASALGVGATAALGVAAVLALVAAASDARLGGFRLPYHSRQVNELWFSSYRAWVYGLGFGWQIGNGLATFIMTAAVYLLVAMAALSASPLVALGLGALFGLVRGLAVFLGAGITSTERLMAFHRRFDAAGPVVRWVVVGVQLAVAVVAAGAAWGAPGAAGVAGLVMVAGGIAALAAGRPATRPTARPAQPLAAASPRPPGR
jgi:hypothetical protein